MGRLRAVSFTVGNCVCQDFACFRTSFEMLCMWTNVLRGLYKVWKEGLSRLACFWDLRVRFFASDKWPFWQFACFPLWIPLWKLFFRFFRLLVVCRPLLTLCKWGKLLETCLRMCWECVEHKTSIFEFKISKITARSNGQNAVLHCFALFCTVFRRFLVFGGLPGAHTPQMLHICNVWG